MGDVTLNPAEMFAGASYQYVKLTIFCILKKPIYKMQKKMKLSQDIQNHVFIKIIVYVKKLIILRDVLGKKCWQNMVRKMILTKEIELEKTIERVASLMCNCCWAL